MTDTGQKSTVDLRVTAAALLGVTGLAGVLALLDTGGAVRLVATVAFFLVVPGWAVVAFARPALSSTVVAVAIAVSIAVDVLVAMVMLLTGGWQPRIAFAVLAVASAALLVIHLARGTRT